VGVHSKILLIQTVIQATLWFKPKHMIVKIYLVRFAKRPLSKLPRVNVQRIFAPTVKSVNG